MFGAYIGSKCIVKQGRHNKGNIINCGAVYVSQNNTYTIWDNFEQGYGSKSFKIKPILSPLSEISDEDAIGVAKIIYQTNGWEVELPIKGDFKILKRSNTGIMIGCTNDMNLIIGHHSEILFTDEFNDPYPTALHYPAIDYLRSKSYDCGFQNINSLIDAGLAVQKIK